MPQQECGALETDIVDEGVGAGAGLLFEDAHELCAGKMGGFGHFLYIPVVFGGLDDGLNQVAEAFVLPASEDTSCALCFLLQIVADEQCQ